MTAKQRLALDLIQEVIDWLLYKHHISHLLREEWLEEARAAVRWLRGEARWEI